jgi:hypothetical protein
MARLQRCQPRANGTSSTSDSGDLSIGAGKAIFVRWPGVSWLTAPGLALADLAPPACQQFAGNCAQAQGSAVMELSNATPQPAFLAIRVSLTANSALWFSGAA